MVVPAQSRITAFRAPWYDRRNTKSILQLTPDCRQASSPHPLPVAFSEPDERLPHYRRNIGCAAVCRPVSEGNQVEFFALCKDWNRPSDLSGVYSNAPGSRMPFHLPVNFFLAKVCPMRETLQSRTRWYVPDLEGCHRVLTSLSYPISFRDLESRNIQSREG